MKHRVLIAGFVCLLVACSSTNSPTTGVPQPPVNTSPSPQTFIRSLPNWPEPQPSRPSREVSKTNSPSQVAGEVCTTTKYDLLSRHDDIVRFSPDSTILWLGNLVQGKDVQRGLGSLAQVPVEPNKRQPLTISIDLPMPNSSREVSAPSQSSVRQAVNELINQAAQSNIAFPSSTSFQVTERGAYTESQVAGELGIDLGFVGIPLGTRLALNTTSTTSSRTLVAYFVQKAFTVNVDLKGRDGADAFFNNTFTSDDLTRLAQSGAIAPDNLPTYVASITYGRVMMFSITSSETTNLTEIQGALEAWRAGNLNASQRSLLQASTTSVRFVTLGGTEEVANRAIREGNFSEFFAQTTPLTAMVPISYEVRTVKENRIASVNRTSEYSVTACAQATTQDIRVTLIGLEVTRDCDGGITQGAGEFYFEFLINGVRVVNRPRTNVVALSDGDYFPINVVREITLSRQSGQAVTISGSLYEADDTITGTNDILVGDFDFRHAFDDSPPWRPNTYVARRNPNSSCDVSFYYRVETL